MSLVFERQREYGKGVSSHNNLILFWRSLGSAASNEDNKWLEDVGYGTAYDRTARQGISGQNDRFSDTACNTKSPSGLNSPSKMLCGRYLGQQIPLVRRVIYGLTNEAIPKRTKREHNDESKN